RAGAFGNGADPISLDSLLAGMYAPVQTNAGLIAGMNRNPYFAPGPHAASGGWLPSPNTTLWTPIIPRPQHFQEFADQRESASLWKMFAVSRLDGPTALLAAGLVDKAVAAEVTLHRSSGT